MALGADTAIASKSGPVPGEGFNCFWRYAAERQQIYLRRQAGKPAPWTADPVLSAYRFTNVYRATDRVSQYLISRVQYNRAWSWRDTFVRTLVFKIFNRPQTWEYLLAHLGEITSDDLESGRIDKSLERLAARRPLYNAAYVMPPPNRLSGPKFKRHMELLRWMLRGGVHLRIKQADSLQAAFEVLRSCPSLGDFLAYQFIIDLNYSPCLDFEESEFVIAGPGALRGLRKCFVQTGGLTDSELIFWTTRRQAQEFVKRGLSWAAFGGRPLQPVDIQNVFCEVDKYTRIAQPHLSRLAPGKRIKQRYRASNRSTPLPTNFPPKWQLVF